MKSKTIKLVLKKKFNEWVESITDDAVKTLVKRDSLITGGSIVSLLLNEKVHDFDVYFATKEATLAVAKYYVEKFKENPPPRFKESGEHIKISVVEEGERVKIAVKSQGIAGESESKDYQYFEGIDDPTEPQEFVENIVDDKEKSEKEDKGKKYRPVFLSSNAISLSHGIQVVIRFFGNVEQIHENYDFVHCTCSWEAATGELHLPPAALECMLNRELRYKRSKYPLCSIIRTRKFLTRGWKITAGQYVKMAWDLNKLDLTDIDTLEDQMIGVDSAYFKQIIDLLRDRGGEKVDETYLMEIIDKVF